MRWTRIAALVALAVTSSAAAAGAQGLSISLRGGAGMPVGQFAASAGNMSQEELLAGARTGFGYGLDAAYLITSGVGLYGGFDRVAFDCEEAACGRNNGYSFSGLSAGLQVLPVRLGALVPWVKVGVTFDELRGAYSSENGVRDLRAERAPGYELGAGLYLPLMGIISFSPQVRYVGQHPRIRVPGVDAPVSESVGYFMFDAGLSFHPPFGGGGGFALTRHRR